jgi:hypothetical protein
MSEKSSIKTGDIYNPFKVFVGLFIPNCIAESALSQAAKLCFGKLCQYAGSDGKCFPKQETLAKAIGIKSISQLRGCIKELEIANLIRRIKPTGKDKLMHKTDTYYFIWDNELFVGKKDNSDDGNQTKNNEKQDTQNETSEVTIYSQSANPTGSQSNRRESLLNVESGSGKAKAFSTNSKKQNLQEDIFQDKSLNTSDQARSEQNQKQSIESPPRKDKPKPKRKSQSIESQKTGQAKILRAGSKTVNMVPKKSKPKRKYKILKANQLYWDIATEYDIKIPERPTAKNYKAMDLIFTELREGTFFEYTPDCEHLINRKITPADFDRFCLHFTLAVSSPEYKPKSLSVKQSWKNWYLTDLLYKNNSRNPDGKSLFAIYLDKMPEKVESDIRQIKDSDPEGTDVVITQCMDRLGLDLSNGGRSSAIKCVQKLTNYFEENKDNIIGYDTYYSLLYQQVPELLDMLDYNSSPEYPVKELYLHGEITYSKKMTEHFKRINVWRS